MRSARVQFHALASGGEAVGRDENGKTVFAPFAAPGDLALVQITTEKSAFARGLIREIEVASPVRTVAPCPQFRPHAPLDSCGGCAWQHLSIGAQRAAKREIVRDAWQRIGGNRGKENESIIEQVRGGAAFAYRNKADFVLGRAQNGGENGAEIGFFARESHHLIDAPNCPIQNEGNEEILRAAREIVKRNPDFVFDAKSGSGIWRRLVARVSSGGESLATLLVCDQAALQSAKIIQIAEELRARVPHLVGVLASAERGETKTLWGQNHLIERVNDLDFRVSGGAFWQVNTQMSPLLAQAALELAQIQDGQRALDLFCGAGFFALHLARAGAQVTGIETHRGAIEDAIYNAKRNNLNARFRSGNAARELARFGAGDFDLVVLDPPRAGARECLSSILRIAPSRIVYVSCDMATWARDAKILGEGGYGLRRAIPFDLFPQTAHVEVVSLFQPISSS